MFDNNLLVNSMALLGLMRVSSIAWHYAKGITTYCLLPRKDLKARYGGGWALVTGASDGLGKGYCFELARNGFHIILLARNQAKLDKVAAEIREQYPGIKTEVVVFDFATLDKEESIIEL